jgi:hypothetical protein
MVRGVQAIKNITNGHKQGLGVNLCTNTCPKRSRN